MKNLKPTISKILAASLVLAVAVNTLSAVFSAPASSQSGRTTTVPGAGACFDGTFVRSDAVSVNGPNNDLYDDCENLIAIKNHWGGRTSVWGAPGRGRIDSWDHIEISNGRVTELILQIRSLGGTIPSAIGNLSALTELSLYNNNITGQIPSSFCNLSNLEEIQVDNNQLTGTLPSCFGSLSELRMLELDDNRFTGNIPSSWGNLRKLTWLDVSDNQLSGSLPSELGNLAPSQGGSLNRFDICNNSFTGNLPQNLRPADINRFTSHSQDATTVQCQRVATPFTPAPTPSTPETTPSTPAPSTPETTPSTPETTPSTPGSTTPAVAPGQGESSYNLSSEEIERCTVGPLIHAYLGRFAPDIRVPGPNNDIIDDCLALMEFRQNYWHSWSSRIQGWGVYPDRANRIHISVWTGVTIRNNRVTALNLRGFFIQGTRPGGLAPLSKLTALRILDLSDNDFEGSIPASLGNLPNLSTFAFCDNRLTGSVPVSLRTGVSLVNYPTQEGYDPIQCQNPPLTPVSPSSTTTTTTTVPDTTTTTSTTTTTTTTTTGVPDTTTTQPRTSRCDADELNWPALAVGEGGASIAAMRDAILPGSDAEGYSYFRWSRNRSAWVRIPVSRFTNTRLAEGTIISVRCVTTDADTLTRLNLLGGQERLSLRQGWNLIVAPESVTRPEGARSAFFIAENLTNCSRTRPANIGDNPDDPDFGIASITIRSATTGRWAYSAPCSTVIEERTLSDSDTYSAVTGINRGDIVYVWFTIGGGFSQPYDLVWNSEANRYERPPAATGPVTSAN